MVVVVVVTGGGLWTTCGVGGGRVREHKKNRFETYPREFATDRGGGGGEKQRLEGVEESGRKENEGRVQN